MNNANPSPPAPPASDNDNAFRIPTTVPQPRPVVRADAIIKRALTNPQGMTVLPPKGVGVDPRNSLTISVVNAQDPVQAYMKIPSKASKSLDHHAPGWGCVYFGVVLPKVQAGVFQCPPPDQAQLVAIKRLSKVVVHAALARGSRENPYTELELMYHLGDNHHVLGMIEALQDDHYLYIIMPYCQQESLVEQIPWRDGIREHQARVLFRNILENMIYLHKHGICHRDLSPDNCMMLNGRIVFSDLAMSIRIPQDDDNNSNGEVSGYGGYGKAAYLPPEVCLNYRFNTRACDLWSATVILFNLLTGEIAWAEPMPGNLQFRYLVLAQGLARNPANERTVEILMNEPDGPTASKIRTLAQKCLELSPEALDLLSGVLQMTGRWDTAKVVNCDWVQNQEDWAPR
jgi:serine/threonine protein kinase